MALGLEDRPLPDKGPRSRSRWVPDFVDYHDCSYNDHDGAYDYHDGAYDYHDCSYDDHDGAYDHDNRTYNDDDGAYDHDDRSHHNHDCRLTRGSRDRSSPHARGRPKRPAPCFCVASRAKALPASEHPGIREAAVATVVR